MKILLLSNSNNIKNGYGNLTHQSCVYLQKAGIDFTLLLPHDSPRYDYATYSIEYILPSYIFDLKTTKIFDYIRFSYKTDVDIVHSITEFPYAILAAKIAKKNKKPLIIQSAGTYGVKPLLYFPDKIFLKWAYNQASLVTPISVFTQEMIQKFSGTKTPMKIIHPGVDFNHFDVNVDVKDIQEKYPNKKLIVTVGVLKPRKGHDVVLRALGELKKRRDDFHYLIVGSDGEGRTVYYNSLQTLVKENYLENNVTFVGTASDEDLVRYFHAADVYVHTPRLIHMNFEGFGMVYLEAGVCRKPVVAADSGGIRDAVVDGKTGIIVPENDVHATAEAVKKLLDNPGLRNEMGNAGYEYAQKHDWQHIGEQYIEVYKNILNQSIPNKNLPK